MKVDMSRRTRRVPVLALAAVALAIVVLFLLDAVLSGDPPPRRTITVDNQTGQTLQVEVLDSSGSALDLGGFAPKSVTERHEIIDQGKVWTFVARASGGGEVQRVEMSADELAAGGWKVRFVGVAPTPTTQP